VYYHPQVHRLHALFQTPYDEHTPEDEADFYRRNVEAGIQEGGKRREEKEIKRLLWK